MAMIDFSGIFDTCGEFRPFAGFEGLCSSLVSFSEKSRREGLLALEDDLECIENTMLNRMIQLVVDGTDPELVRSIGDRMIMSSLHSLEEILACVEFAGINTGRSGYDGTVLSYIKSRDLGPYAELAASICASLPSLAGGQADAGGRMADILELMGSGMDDDLKHELMMNHMDSIIYTNRVYNEIVLTGALGIQAGDNPRVLAEKLRAHVPGVLWNECRADGAGFAEECCAGTPPGEVTFPGLVVIDEIIASMDHATGEFIPASRFAKLAGDGLFLPGDNTKVSGGSLLASINGDIVFAEGRINVELLYVVNGDVCLETGSVVFMGSIAVRGDVREGFSVNAKGNVYIAGRIDEGAAVTAGGSIIHV